MAYAQKNYQQKLGNGSYTIAEAGCLLTAFCNGLEILNGSGPDPVTLNQYFVEHGTYIKDSDGANEDLAWNSITAYDSTIMVSAVGLNSTPPSNNAIVKFHYNSVQTGQPIDHFCWVADAASGSIIDSWDGVTKSPAQYESIYHSPIGWATYIKNVPPPPPAPTVALAPPAAPITAGNSADTYNILLAIPGYVHASDAAKGQASNSEVPVGQYYVFNRDGGMINVTRILGQPGWWINPTNNVLPPPTPSAFDAPAAAPTPPAPVVAPAKPEVIDDWRTTYVPLNPQRSTVYYLALQTITVHDLAGNNKDLPLEKYQVVPVEGTFINNGIVYGRTISSVKKSKWYGIPMTNLSLESDTFNATTTPLERIAIGTPNLRDKALKLFHDIGKLLDKLSVSKITNKD